MISGQVFRLHVYLDEITTLLEALFEEADELGSDNSTHDHHFVAPKPRAKLAKVV